MDKESLEPLLWYICASTAISIATASFFSHWRNRRNLADSLYNIDAECTGRMYENLPDFAQRETEREQGLNRGDFYAPFVLERFLELHPEKMKEWKLKMEIYKAARDGKIIEVEK